MGNTGKMIMMIVVGLLILVLGIVWIIFKSRETAAMANAAAVANLLCEGRTLTEADFKEKYADPTFQSNISTIIKHSGTVSNWLVYAIAGLQIIIGIVVIVWAVMANRKVSPSSGVELVSV